MWVALGVVAVAGVVAVVVGAALVVARLSVQAPEVESVDATPARSCGGCPGWRDMGV